jgi:nitroimidazol reductase NimA-like FMN-containing flavoprotein (pyridoxamine 5'-phosphate oxidase superfamily)
LTESSVLAETLSRLCREQLFAVLATQALDKPYASLVAFAAAPDLRTIIFATNKGAGKYANLIERPNAALLIDNRSNNPTDTQTATAVTASGKVSETDGAERDRFLALYAHKHPGLVAFASNADTALMKLEVDSYLMVTRFQNVVTLRVTPDGLRPA